MDSNASVTVSQSVDSGAAVADPTKRRRPQLWSVTQIVFSSVYWSKASRPLSRPPNPDPRKPPKGVEMSLSQSARAGSSDAVVRLSQNDGLAGRSGG